MTAHGRGILITNLGSPAEPTPLAVKTYLEEFLMDPRVITLPYPIRYLLVKAITRKRQHTSAEAYTKIWTATGGPLRDHSNALATLVSDATSLPVAVAMRYGEPSFEAALEALKDDCDEVLIVSPYPQFAESTFVSMIEHAKKVFKSKNLLVTQPFYDEAKFVEAHANQLQSHIKDDTDHLLCSFHGIPLRQIRAADSSGQHCLKKDDCCKQSHEAQSTCYRYQCLHTAEAIAANISVPYSVSFQSRLGRAAWLLPYTVDVVRQLANDGVRNLTVTCPSFVSDNLETLYEIGIEIRDVFKEAGGSRLDLVPCLNESEIWVNLVIEWCRAKSDSHLRLA